MKKFIVLLILGSVINAIPAILKAEIITAQDTIKTDVTWSADTVKVMSHIFIWDDAVLTIEEGTRVEFHGPHYILVHGTIRAEGTKQDTIVFTRVDTAGYWDETVLDGAWNGILFNNAAGEMGADGAMDNNDTSVLNYCLVEYVKTSETEGAPWACISVNVFTRLVIKNSEFRNNYSYHSGGAISAGSESDIQVLGNYIHHNRAYQRGGGIWVKNNASVIIGNTIEHNSTTGMDDFSGKGGGLSILGMNPVVKDNIIRFNSAFKGGGIYMDNCFGLIEENIITYNTCYNDPGIKDSYGGGISANIGSTAKIFNNKLANNEADHGGGISSWDSDINLISNLIVNNSAAISGGALDAFQFYGVMLNNTMAHNDAVDGGAIYFDDAKPLFMNNIVWHNPDASQKEIELSGFFSKIHIQNSVIHGGTSTISGQSTPTLSDVTLMNPAFVDTTGGVGTGFVGLSGKWRVRDTSVCINAGNDGYEGMMPEKDINGNPRVLHSYIDIGSHELYVPSITVQDSVKTNTTWIADTVKVDTTIVIVDDVTLTILPGTRVEFLDTHRIQVVGTLIAEGEPSNRIVFTVSDTAGSYDKNSPSGSWQGVHFINDLENQHAVMDDNDPSVLKYCDFSYISGLGEYNVHNISAVRVRYFDSLTISNCRFFENYFFYESASLNLNKANLTIEECEFYNNFASQGPALWIESSEVTIKACNIHGNSSIARGGAVCAYGSDLTIESCDFRWNHCDQRGGAVYGERTKALITHSWFENNYANGRGGAICLNFENFQLHNNVMVNNTGGVGGAVYSLYADDALTMNNTICNNWSGGGGGIYNAFCNHTSINDILYGNDVDNNGKQYGMYSTAVDISFHNTILQGGIEEIGFWIGQEVTGTFENIMDTLPEFTRPTDGPGSDYDAGNARWVIKSISPAINNGAESGPAYLVEFDIRGNSRVYDTVIDIGAIESQYGPPEIVTQLDNHFGCEGDTVHFYARARFQSYYQWQKDGEDIPGATDQTLILENITAGDEGNYKCIISNSFGSVETNAAYLLTRSAPEFVRQPQSTWAIEGEKTIISTTAIGTQPLNLQWYKDGIELANRRWPDLWIFNPDSAAEGRYHCEATNECQTVSSDTVQLWISPQICMVTVDTSTGDNLVVWEKTSTAPIESYNVYRESIVAGVYEVIGNVPAADLSVYSDTSANPAEQAYIYKITALDENGDESDIDLCRPHKTIHLLTSLNTESLSAQLDWDEYYGFDYGTYFIYRSSSKTGFAKVKDISSSFQTWLDSDAPEDTKFYYRVSVAKAEACYPTGNGLKAGTGPYQHSLSNLDDNKLKLGDNPPDSITLNNYSIDENLQLGSLIGRILVHDQDTTKSFTYKLVTGEGELDNSSFTLIGDLLVSAASFDYETKSQYAVRVRATDQGDNSIEQSFVISIVDVEEPALGVGDITAGEIKIYPNPFTSITTVEFLNPDFSEYRLIVRDLSGKMVIMKQINTSRFEIERGNLSTGLYTIELVGEKIFRSRFMIK